MTVPLTHRDVTGSNTDYCTECEQEKRELTDIIAQCLNMPDYHKSRTKAITAFRISSESFMIRPEDWTSREPHAVWYGVPVEVDYIHVDGGTSKHYLVEAFSQDGQVLSYLSLPRQYVPA